jgi:hypothetical protein
VRGIISIFSHLLRKKRNGKRPGILLRGFLSAAIFFAGSGLAVHGHAAGQATLTVMNPRADLRGPTPVPLAPRLRTLEGRRIGLINNTKENATLLQPELEKALREMLPSAILKSWSISYRPFENKNRALEEPAKNSDGILLLIGD